MNAQQRAHQLIDIAFSFTTIYRNNQSTQYPRHELIELESPSQSTHAAEFQLEICGDYW